MGSTEERTDVTVLAPVAVEGRCDGTNRRDDSTDGLSPSERAVRSRSRRRSCLPCSIASLVSRRVGAVSGRGLALGGAPALRTGLTPCCTSSLWSGWSSGSWGEVRSTSPRPVQSRAGCSAHHSACCTSSLSIPVGDSSAPAGMQRTSISWRRLRTTVSMTSHRCELSHEEPATPLTLGTGAAVLPHDGLAFLRAVESDPASREPTSVECTFVTGEALHGRLA